MASATRSASAIVLLVSSVMMVPVAAATYFASPPRYALRKSYPTKFCHEPAALAYAYRLDTCTSIGELGSGSLMYHYDAAAASLTLREFLSDDCSGSSIDVSLVDNTSIPCQSLSDGDSFASFEFVASIPAPQLGFPLVEFEYYTQGCRDTAVNTITLYNAAAVGSCLPAAPSDAHNTTQSISVHRTEGEANSFSVHYYRSANCRKGSMEETSDCNQFCTFRAGTDVNVTIECLADETGHLSLTVANIVAIAIGCSVGAVIIGAGVFWYLRQRSRTRAPPASPLPGYGTLASASSYHRSS